MKVVELKISDRKSRPYVDPAPPFALKLVRVFSATLGRIFPSLLAPVYLKLFMRPRVIAKHKFEDELLKDLRRDEMRYEGKKIRIYEWEINASAPWVVLSHGWQSRGTALRNMVPIMHELGYNVVAFDGPAHGESEGKYSNMLIQSRVLDQLVSRYPSVRGIIGHSFGNTVATYLYSNSRKDESLDFMVVIASPNRLIHVFEEFKSVVGAPENLYRAILQLVESKFDVEVEELNVQDLFEQCKINHGIIVHDKNDRITKIDNARQLHKKKPNFTLIETQGLGHFSLAKNNQVLALVKKELESQLVKLD